MNLQYLKIWLLLILIFGGTVSYKVETTNGAIITSVSYVFETFSPYALIRFFEFSDKGWNISENCLKDMYNYLEGLRKGSIWAVKLYDATGYYNGGAFGSNNIRMHNPQLCRNLQNEHNEMLNMHWNLRLNATVVPFPVQIVVGNYIIEMATKNIFKYEKIQQLVCFPQSCIDPDLQQILDVYLFQSNHIVKNMTFFKHRTVTDNYGIFQDIEFYVLLTLISSSLLIFAVAHFSNGYCSILEACKTDILKPNLPQSEQEYHIVKGGEHCKALQDFEKLRNSINLNIAQFPDRKPVNSGNLNFLHSHKAVNLPTKLSKPPKLVEARKICLIHELIDAVSIQSVLHNLSKRDTADSSTVQTGIFVISSILIIYAQTAAQIGFIANNLNYLSKHELSFQHILRKQATYLIDVYFFVSGSNLTLQFFKTIPQGKWNVFEQLLHLLSLIVSKVCSISLSYTFALIMQHLVSKYFHYNTAMELPSFDFLNCEGNKWRNVLYIDMFFPIEERCMPWTWFISLEVQFFTVACLVLLLAKIHPKYAGAICFTIFTVSLIASTILEMDPHNQFNLDNSIQEELMQFNLIFDKIWLRIPPYLLGMCLGYILYKTNAKINLNIFVIICGWIACLLILCFFLFGYQLTLFRANPIIRAAVTTLGHTIWAMILLWVILSSITQHGKFLRQFFASNYLNTLEKLSTISFIIGPLLIRLFLVSGDVPIYSSDGQIFVMALGYVLLIYVSSLGLYIFLDGPLIAILNVIIKRNALA